MIDTEENVYEFRAFPHGVDRYSDFMKNGFMSLGWQDLKDVSKKNLQQVKNKIEENHSDYSGTRVSQIANFFERLKSMKKGDIILIPYIKDRGPIVTVAIVTEPYHFNISYTSEDMAQQIGIRRVADLDREELAERFPSLHNSLKARLSLTSVNKEQHAEAIKYIKSIISKTPDLASENSDDITKEYVKNLNNIKNAIDGSANELIIKSLILSALIINEAYLTNKIIRKINKSTSGDDEVFQGIVQREIIQNLFKKSLREKIAREYFDSKGLPSKYSRLRNLLAHDIMSVSIAGDSIVFREYRGESNQVDIKIEDLFEVLTNFIDEFAEDYPMD